jgi:hypothetical protein
MFFTFSSSGLISVGNYCDDFTPSSVLCRNAGSDGLDAQWKCEADLPTEYRFDSIDVNCEGYAYPDDPYILAGSCGLEYSLTRSGERGGGRGGQQGGYRSPYASGSQAYGGESENTIGATFAIWLAAAFIIYVIYKVCFNRDSVGGVGGGVGGGGGGGGGSPWGPGGPGGGGGAPSYGGGQSDPNCAPNAGSFFGGGLGGGAQQGGGPGFWSGLLGGGAMGYCCYDFHHQH